MSKFNVGTVRPAVFSPITTAPAPSGRTHEGAPGWARSTKGELFLLAVSNKVGEDTFYEKAGARDDRYEQLVRAATTEDPEWTAAFLGWLRSEGNMRSASLVGAAAFAAERVARHEPGLTRGVVASVLQRADEPGEFLAYWMARYGRKVPIAVKRGLADAVTRLYDERAVLKWDSGKRALRMADVIELVHPTMRAPRQGDLFKHLIDERHDHADGIPESLGTLRARAELMALPVGERRAALDPERLRAAGMTWEAVAGWLQGPMDAAAWESLIPTMNLMAQIRNLRNFDEAGVSDEAAAAITARLADPEQIARSRQFPFRFWAAYKHAPSLRWGHALEQALNHSLTNVPVLSGRTLVLVDRSPSMFPGYPFSTPNKSDIPLAEQAALFGAAIALRAEHADLVEYGMTNRPVDFRKGGSVLRLVEKFTMIDGTDTARAIAEHYRDHDRVLIVTDEQTSYSRYGTVDERVPAHVPVYSWNVGGHRLGHGPSGSRNRHALGGLTDSAFRLIPLLETGVSGIGWPWENAAA